RRVYCKQCPDSDTTIRTIKVWRLRIQRHFKWEPAGRGEMKPPANQKSGKPPHLDPRCSVGSRRVPATNEYCSCKRPSRFPADNSEAWQCFNAGYHLWNQIPAAPHYVGASSRTEGRTAGGPIIVRPRFD